MSELLKKITDLPSGTPTDAAVIPYVEDNITKKALKSELKGDKGDKGDAATVDAGTTTTLAAGESATVTNSGTTAAAIFNFGIPQGIQGEDGACVESVAFVGNDIVFTLDDASTVTLTDAKITLKGETGETGAKIVSSEFVGDDLVFTLDDSSTATVLGAKTALKGDKGDTGDTGIDWQGAWSAGTYTATQAVSHNGSSWIATTTTTEEPSISATDWDLIALKGTDGAGSGDISGSGVANEIAYFTAEKTIDNLPVATYPSLAELSYVKGVTSAIQTQLNSKQASGSYEVTTNKENSTIDTSTTKYPTVNLLKTGLDAKAPLASPTFTGTVTLPKTIEIQDTSADHKYVLAVNELTADRTVTLPLLTGNDEFVFKDHTQTLTNKRITTRVSSETSSATPTINTDNVDAHSITALAANITSFTTNLSGTPTNFQKLIIRIKDDGTARTISWGSSFEANGAALPTTTVISKVLTVGFIYDTVTSKWGCVASAQET